MTIKEIPLNFKCENVIQISDSVAAYMLRLMNSERYHECVYGKHLLLTYPDMEGSLQTRSYSIVGRHGSGLIEIAVKRQSDNGLSASIHKSFMKDSMLVVEKLTGTLTCDSLLHYQRVLFACGGVGITLPLGLIRGLAALSNKGKQIPYVKLVVCVPRVGELIYLYELMLLQARYSWLSVSIFITRELFHSRVAYLTQGRPHPAQFTNDKPEAALICGSSSFVFDWEQELKETLPQIDILDQHKTNPRDVFSDETLSSMKAPIKLVLARTKRQIMASPTDTLLQTLEAHGVTINSQCRMGVCGRCSVRVVDGKLESLSETGLSILQRSSGYHLACCSRPVSEEVTIDL